MSATPARVLVIEDEKQIRRFIRVAVEEEGCQVSEAETMADIPAALALCGNAGLEADMMDTSFFLGRETLIPRLGSSMAYWRSLIFVAMFRNAGSATAYFKIPSNRVVELGSQVVL
jgi:K+ transporter